MFDIVRAKKKKQNKFVCVVYLLSYFVIFKVDKRIIYRLAMGVLEQKNNLSKNELNEK